MVEICYHHSFDISSRLGIQTFCELNIIQVRARADNTSIGHQAHKWPFTLACGYDIFPILSTSIMKFCKRLKCSIV
uniref:Ovule protein n=1 Tax=Heterorhabditis bacteriophora TaxID=37862 RepID=A0A1I7WKK8_HETBA